ncbi:hypothetical protein EHZ12_15780, partial [Clostridium perfringens]
VYTMLESLKGNTNKALAVGCNTLMLAGSIAIGIVLVSSFTTLFFSTKIFISKIKAYKKIENKECRK